MSPIEHRLRDLADDYRAQTTVSDDMLARARRTASRRTRRRVLTRSLLAAACLVGVVVSLAVVAGGGSDDVEDAGTAEDVAPATSTVSGVELVGAVCRQLDTDLTAIGPVFQTLPAFERATGEWADALARATALATTAVVDATSASTRDEVLGVLAELTTLTEAATSVVEAGDVVAAAAAFSQLEERAVELLPEATGTDVECGRFS